MKTDTEIAIAALTDWPREACPDGWIIECIPGTARWNFDGVKLGDNKAIALFVASGLGWLLGRDRVCSVEVFKSAIDHTVEVDLFTTTERHSGPTLLSAIDASIKAQGEQK